MTRGIKLIYEVRLILSSTVLTLAAGGVFICLFCRFCSAVYESSAFYQRYHTFEEATIESIVTSFEINLLFMYLKTPISEGSVLMFVDITRNQKYQDVH